MNAPVTPRSILKHHVAAIEAWYPLEAVGLPPGGSAAHVGRENALAFLARRRGDLSLLDPAPAETDLGDLPRRPLGIVLVSGPRGREAAESPKIADPP
jgi:hypothetical protein